MRVIAWREQGRGYILAFLGSPGRKVTYVMEKQAFSDYFNNSFVYLFVNSFCILAYVFTVSIFFICDGKSLLLCDEI